MKNEKLHNLIKFLDNVVENTEKDVIKEVKDGILQGVIEDLNTEQLSQGLGSDGATLPEYSDASVELYGKRPGAMRMKDTGYFYESIELEVKKNVLELISDSDRLQAPISLEKNYGVLLGLTEQSQNELTKDYLIDEVVESIKKQIKKI